MSFKMQKSLWGLKLFVTKDDDLVSRGPHASGGEDKPTIVLPGSPDHVALFDDFLGDLIADEWAIVKGDTGISGGAIANVVNGVLRLSGSETIATAAPEQNVALTQGLFKQWKADMGGRKSGRLRLVARVKHPVSVAAEGGRHHLFVGFSDSGGAEMPAYDTGGGIQSPASDVVGFILSPTGSVTDRWTLMAAKGVANDSGDQQVTPSLALAAPVTNRYDTLELEVRNGLGDTGGCAHFWINGKKVGTINSPVGSGVALTPWIGGFVQDTGFAQAIDIDLVNVSAPRDTGE